MGSPSFEMNFSHKTSESDQVSHFNKMVNGVGFRISTNRKLNQESGYPSHLISITRLAAVSLWI